jgi:hypothetical protein
MIPRIAPDNKAISFLTIDDIGISHAGGNTSCAFKVVIAITPALRIGAVKIYDTQNPLKFDRQTSGTRIKITLNDSLLRFKIPVNTNENIKTGRISIIMSFRHKLIE